MLVEQIIKVTDYSHACNTIKENITDYKIVKKMLYSISKIYVDVKCPDKITIRKYKVGYKEGFVVIFQYGDYYLQYQKMTSCRTDIITIKTHTKDEEVDVNDYEAITSLFIEILKESLKV